MVQDVTINGITYPDVEAVDYVDKSGVKHSLDKLMLNNAVAWRKPVPLPEKDTLENMSWEDISTVCKAGKAAEYWSVGDQKTITVKEPTGLSGSYINRDVVVRIIGFDHDDVADAEVYGRAKAGATFDMVGALSDDVRETGESWDVFDIRTNTLAGYYNRMSSDFKNAVVMVEKQSLGRGREQIITKDRFFAMSEFEIFGTTINSLGEEGSQYAYYQSGGTTDKKQPGYNSPGQWYTRSIYAPITGNIWHIVVYKQTSTKLNSYACISFAFCV